MGSSVEDLRLSEIRDKRQRLQNDIFSLIIEFEKETSAYVKEIYLMQDAGLTLDVFIKTEI